MQKDSFERKKQILDANADWDLRAGSGLWREQMAPLQGDDQSQSQPFMNVTFRLKATNRPSLSFFNYL